jgi:hypothetical protein
MPIALQQTLRQTRFLHLQQIKYYLNCHRLNYLHVLLLRDNYTDTTKKVSLSTADF